MRHFERESERCQLFHPHLAAARTALLDYFRDLAENTATDRLLFRFERTMAFGKAEKDLLTQLALQLGFPRDEATLRNYLSGEDEGMIDLFPELATFRDIVYYTKAAMVPSSDALPEMRSWTISDARLGWHWKDDKFAVKAFGGTLQCAGWLEADPDDEHGLVRKQEVGFFQKMFGKVRLSTEY